MSGQSHLHPELKIFADGIAFKLSTAHGRPADRVHDDISSEILGALFAIPILASLGVGLVLVGVAAPEVEPAARWALFIVGWIFVVVAVLAALRMGYQIRYRERVVLRRLGPIPVELSVEQRRLIRRYALGREEAWPRDQIADVKVLTVTTVGGESNETITISQLTLLLRDGGSIPLHEDAAPGSFAEMDLYWMAGELRGALQVPYDAPPMPIDGAVLERSAEGIVVRLPHVDPEAAWRESWRTWLIVGANFVGFLAIIWVFGSSWAFFFEEVGSEAWKNSLFLVVAMLILGAIFGGLALIEYFCKGSVMREFADRTVVSLGVRAVTLCRTHASGRVESWPAAEIAEVNVLPTGSKATSPLGVFLQLKQGKPIHLYGKVDQHPRSKLQQEGLRWLADELGKALGLLPATLAPAPVEAIVDLSRTSIQAEQDRCGIVDKEAR